MTHAIAHDDPRWTACGRAIYDRADGIARSCRQTYGYTRTVAV